MGCEYVNAGGIRAIVCGRGHGRRKACKVCGRAADRQCDWKVPGKRSGTCDANICSNCSTQPAPDKDLCPTHAEAWRAWKKAKGVDDGEGEGQAAEKQA